MTRLAAGAAAVLGMLMLASCSGGGPRPTGRPSATASAPAAVGLSLVAFDGCPDLLAGLRTAAGATVGPYGLFGGPVLERGAAGRPVAGDALSVEGDRAGGAYSTTNTHEAGVDEPDLVKTDGARIVTVAGGVLRVVDAATKKVTGSVRIGDAGDEAVLSNLLLAGDHALVFGNGPEGPMLTLVDLTGAPRRLGGYTMEGTLVDARQVGSVARVVVRSQPTLEFPEPSGSMSEDERTALNRKVIDQAPVERWLPRYQTIDASGRPTGRQVGCQDVRRPAQYSGTSLLTVLTFDLSASGLNDGQPVSLVADAQTVYANGPSLYLAADQRWQAMRTYRRGPGAPARTQIYKFDISGAGKPRYVAGGEVGGWLLNQYALSEWDGRLRVATTQGEPWRQSGSAASAVTVLDATLRRVGSVGGLGTGERIYAVRFIGPIGYVVTFRQTDPLYTLDLHDPAAPEAVGRLELYGYSAYLHPAGDGRLLGLGQSATAAGRATGLQVSLFDTHDPARPARLANVSVGGEYSSAEDDPHAFLYWAPTGTLVVPGEQDMLVFRVQGTTLTRAGALAPRSAAGSPWAQRSLVINTTLWRVGSDGLAANDLATLADAGWVPFG
jgi:hypothetical protein